MKINKKSTPLLTIAASLWIGNGIAMSQETLKILPAQVTQAKVREGLQLFAWVEKTRIEVGEPIVLHFALRNTGKEDVVWVQHLDNLPEKEFRLEVKDDQNEIMPRTKYGKLVPQILACENLDVLIKSGQELRNTLLASRLYDMTGSRNYSIVLKTYLLGIENKGKTIFMPSPLDEENPLMVEITANAVQVEIVQPNRGTSPKPQTSEKE